MKSKSLELEDKPHPLSCQWEITCRCNLRCVMCYTNCMNTPQKNRQELSTPEIFQIIDQLAEEGCLEITFTGGEPFARPDFPAIYEYAARKGFLITLFSNGTLITESIADLLANYPPCRIEITLHGVTPGTFESITQTQGSFDKCLAAIELLRKRNLNLTLKTMAITLNKAEIFDIKNYVQSLGNVRFRLGEKMQPALDASGHPRHFQLPDGEFEKIKTGDRELYEDACKQKAAPAGQCNAGFHQFHLDPYGMLQLCPMNRRDRYDLKQGTLQEGFFDFLPTCSCPLEESARDKAQPQEVLYV